MSATTYYRVCKHCDAEFALPTRAGGRPVYCSADCRRSGRSAARAVQRANRSGRDIVKFFHHGAVPVDSGCIFMVDPAHLPAELVDRLLAPNEYGVVLGVLAPTPFGDGMWEVVEIDYDLFLVPEVPSMFRGSASGV